MVPAAAIADAADGRLGASQAHVRPERRGAVQHFTDDSLLRQLTPKKPGNNGSEEGP
jgi:hypothetical protein